MLDAGNFELHEITCIPVRPNDEEGIMEKEVLINVLQPEESRIAIVEDGILEELYVDRTSIESYVGNVYKGRVVNIEPSIQAVFVDFGVGRNGFLHVSDVEYQYYKHLLSEKERSEVEKGRGSKLNDRTSRSKPPIQEIFQRGSEVLVQVTEAILGLTFGRSTPM